jgi:hypothetical protein
MFENSGLRIRARLNQILTWMKGIRDRRASQLGRRERFGQIESGIVSHNAARWIEAGARRSQSPITATVRAAMYLFKRFADK